MFPFFHLLHDTMVKKYCSFILVAFGCMVTTHAQDTTWYSKEFKKVSNRFSASTYTVLFSDKSDSSNVRLLSYTTSDTLLTERNFYPYYPNPVLHGFYRVYEGGQLVEERVYKNDRLHGHYRTFRKNGLVRRDDLYENGKFISGKCYGVNGSDTAWFERIKPAVYPGGMDSLQRFIRRNIRYPAIAKATGAEGRVLVAFNIAKDGSLVNIVVKESADPELDKEALRIVHSMPAWIPGTLEGEPVKFAYRLPIVFRFNEQ